MTRVRPLLTVVTPAFNEAQNLLPFYEALRAALSPDAAEWEWIVVDDHSQDGTFGEAARIASGDRRVRAIRLARNAGSHAAALCGLHRARGDCAVMMAADLQDPPWTLPALLARWREGAHVVWAVRERREGEPGTTLAFSRLYWALMRHVAGFRNIPPRGADFFLLDRKALEALQRIPGAGVNLLLTVFGLGFRQVCVPYVKQARARGRSGWTLGKKLRLVADSLIYFTDRPARWMAGLAAAVFTSAVLVAVALAAADSPAARWTPALLIAVLAMCGIQMGMIAVLGAYAARALNEARRPPPYLVEEEEAGGEEPSAVGVRPEGAQREGPA